MSGIAIALLLTSAAAVLASSPPYDPIQGNEAALASHLPPDVLREVAAVAKNFATFVGHSSSRRSSTFTSFLLDHSRVTINSGGKRRARIVVKDAARRGFVCLPRGTVASGSGRTDSSASAQLAETGGEHQKARVDLTTVGQGQGITATVDAGTAQASAGAGGVSVSVGGASASAGKGSVSTAGSTSASSGGVFVPSGEPSGVVLEPLSAAEDGGSSSGADIPAHPFSDDDLETSPDEVRASAGSSGASASAGDARAFTSSGGASAAAGDIHASSSSRDSSSHSEGSSAHASTSGEGYAISSGSGSSASSSVNEDGTVSLHTSGDNARASATGSDGTTVYSSGDSSHSSRDHSLHTSEKLSSSHHSSSTDSSSTSTSSHSGAGASAGRVSVSVGGGRVSASAGKISVSSGGTRGSSGSRGASASAGGARASAGAGGVSVSVGGGRASASVGGSSAGGAHASAGSGGAFASAGGSHASSSSGEASASTGDIHASSSSRDSSSRSEGSSAHASTSGEGYAISSGSGSSASSSVNEDGTVSLHTSGDNARASATGSDGTTVYSSGGSSHSSRDHSLHTSEKLSSSHQSSSSSADSSSASTSSHSGAGASAGRVSVSVGGGRVSASAGKISVSSGGTHGSSGSRGASASAGGARASAGAGGVSVSVGGGRASASAGGSSASAGGAHASAGSGGAFASAGGSHASSGSGEASASSGGLHTSSSSIGSSSSHASSAGEGYAISSGSGSSASSSVSADGSVSLHVSGQNAQAAGLGSDGRAVTIDTSGDYTAIDESDCECVPDYLCDEDGYINTFGAGLIDIRSHTKKSARAHASKCKRDETCCRHREGEERAAIGWLPETCGTRAPIRLDRRRVQGEATRIGEYPWVAAILKVVQGHHGAPDQLEYICAGSLISETVLLTGAHCIAAHESDRIIVRVGEWDTSSEDSAYPHQDIGVERRVLHEKFDDASLINDVALLKLQEPAELSPHVNTMCLPPEDDYYIDYTDCVANGWGKTSFEQGGYSNILKAIHLNKVDPGQCQARMRQTRLSSYFRLHESFLCAGGLPGVDTCKGDGGAPLVCRDRSEPEQEKYVQIGMVAWGINCGRGGFPGIYVDVIKMLPWIRSNLANLSYDY